MYITLNNFCKQKNINKKTLDGRIRKKGIKPVSKVVNEFYYRKKDLEKLQYFYSTHFFIFPDYQTSDNTKFCMYPEGNVDRNWNGKQESKSNYEEKEEKLLELCIKTKESYKKYRLEIKKILKV